MASDVTIDDILDELETLYHRELRQPLDVDAQQIGERRGISARQAVNVIKTIAKKDRQWEAVIVYDPDKAKYLWVLRKAANG